MNNVTETLCSKFDFNAPVNFLLFRIDAFLTALEEKVSNRTIELKVAIELVNNLIESETDEPNNIADEVMMGWIEGMNRTYGLKLSAK